MNLTRRHWLAIGLCTSIALNLFLAGFLATGWYQQKEQKRVRIYFEDAAKVLTPEERATVSATRDRYMKEIRAAYKDLHVARRAIFDVLTADQIDKNELDAGFKRIRTERERLHVAVHQAIGEMALQIAPERRGEFLKSYRYRGMFIDRRRKN